MAAGSSSYAEANEPRPHKPVIDVDLEVEVTEEQQDTLDAEEDADLAAEDRFLDAFLVRKVDLRLCTIAGILCSLNLLDSGIISSASVTSIFVDLGLGIGNRYSLSILVYTVASVVFQLPATVAVRLIGPRIWFAGITVAFGVITLCTAFIHTWRQMVILRVLLGMAQSAIFPGLSYLISTWYTRKEQQLRFAFLQSGEVTVWMFLVQGLIAIVIGIVTYWWMVDFPENAHRSFCFITKEEQSLAVSRIMVDRDDVQAESFSLRKCLIHFLDLKIYGFCALFFCLNLVSTSLSYFLPIILQSGMEFSEDRAILLSAPQYFYAVIPVIISSWISDRYRLRGLVIVFNSICVVAGFGMLGFSSQVTVRYVGTFLGTGGYVSNWAAMNAYQANNIVGQWKRATFAAAITACNGLGGIAGSFIMGFLGVYKAIYDYVPHGDSELAINEGDILYILEKSGEDDWWKAKKRATAEDDDEPTGLIPNNYVEQAQPMHSARALYDYTRQTDEELSFSEDAQLEVFDTSDPDWILVGLDGEYGFAPANYIEVNDDDAPPTPARPSAAQREVSSDIEHQQAAKSPVVQTPEAAIAGIIGGRTSRPIAPPPALSLPPPQYTPEASDEEEEPTPTLPARPQSQSVSSHDYPSPRSPGVVASPPYNRAAFRGRNDDTANRAPGGYHLYNINEMVSVMGKRKKMPTTLGINLATGTIMIAPEKERDGPTQEWTAEKMTHYSIEGKHVFLELIRPSKSADFHAGAKDTAMEIDAALRDLAGAIKAEGLREVMMAATGHSQKTGQVLYDFVAQGDDEVSVAVDDEVVILDDTKSEEWWQVRRVKNGKEGVVPSSYIEITGVISAGPATSGLNAAKSTVERNRQEEQRLAMESARSHREEDLRASEVGPGMRLPQRGSSLSALDSINGAGQQRNKRESRQSESSQSRSSKSKPDVTKVRTWTDRSKSFSVEAQFLALKDGKINLHKMNGVKIAVPVAKMSVGDLEYVERITGVSLDEDKPLSEVKKHRSRASSGAAGNSSAPAPVGASIEQKPEYDWFPFFLSCDVAVGMCERYAQIFNKGSIDESVLPDVDASVLRNLGIREGDIIKIMRFLDNKYDRKSKRNVSFAGSEDGDGDASPGGLFSGPGGALRNNTRKGRPAPTVQTNDIVDPKAFSQGDPSTRALPEGKATSGKPASATSASAPPPFKKDRSSGFDDDAWDLKPIKQLPTSRPTAPEASRPAPPPQQPALTGAMQELSLLDTPLQPSKIEPKSQPIQQQPPIPPPIQQAPPQQQPQAPQQVPQQPPQSTGATPAFFSELNQQPTGLQPQPTNPSFNQNSQFVSQQNIARQRPAAPAYNQNASSLMIPPPPRPLSAPQAPQQSSFGPPPPLQPQMTGLPNAGYQSPLAPPGQSLAEISQMRMQQQYSQQQQAMQPQVTGFGGQPNNMMMPQASGFNQFQGQQPNGYGSPLQTGFGQSQPYMNGQATGGPFADSRNQQFSPIQQQPPGFQGSFPQQQFPQQTGVNAFLPPALQPQPTAAIQPQPTNSNGFGGGFGQAPPPPPPPPPMPQQQQTLSPLQPQKTGPPPPVRFGVIGDTKKLMPQATGRRANLAHASGSIFFYPFNAKT
ncbi:MAG: cytoskeletal protein binding protein [Claussenomyces sp. TS43310]|nr:MAG: cytoskeletal protein binding protein [Claussenomyces sp. TS43310]